MDKNLIERINFLARKKKTVGLTNEEQLEQDELRNEYRKQFRQNFINQMQNIRVVENVEENSINEMKALSIDQINEAKSGHPGIALGSAPIMYSLFNKVLISYNKKADWINRDRFVLSSGHASSLLYSFLHVCGYGLTIDDLKKFRKLDSFTPGHPEYKHTIGVDATSGPLGQGLAMAVGMAIAEKKMADTFNKEDLKLIDHYTYVMCGDGDLQEGISQEAISLAGNLNLNKLIILYDSNNVTLDGPLSNSNKENVSLRFKSCGFNTMESDDNYENIIACLKIAKKSEKPTFIKINTIIGKGSFNEGTSKVHGSCLSQEDINELKQKLNVNKTPFTISDLTYDDFKNNFIKRGRNEYRKWNKLLNRYRVEYPDDYTLFEKSLKNEINFNSIDSYMCELNNIISTRKASGNFLNLLTKDNPFIIGGSADVASSVMTHLNHTTHISENDFSGQTLNFGVREFAMGAVCNGIKLHGGLSPFMGSFLVFSDYLKPALRMSSLMSLNNVCLFSHDSIAVGEDGPTHQPIEQLVMLRSLPGFTTIRPCNELETKYAYKYAFTCNNPVAIILSRQDLKTNHICEYEEFKRGGYYVINDDKATHTLIATGSEVDLAIEVASRLKEIGKNVNVVSMPMVDVFEKQTKKYKKFILNKGYNRTISFEMAATCGWSKYAKYNFGIDSFGKSGKASDVIRSFGFDVDSLLNKIIKIIK